MLPRQITEHILAKTYGWTVDYIMTLDAADVDTYLYLCLLTQSLDREFQMQTDMLSKPVLRGKRQTKRENAISFDDGMLPDGQKSNVDNDDSESEKEN